MKVSRSGIIDRLAGFPAIRANAGVKMGSLTSSGSITATTGQTISGKYFPSGQVVVGAATGVTIQNCYFAGDGSQYYAVTCSGGAVTIQDCTFTGQYLDSAVSYDGVTMRRCEIVGMHADGVKIGSNTLYEENWIHDFTPDAGNHSDGMQAFEKIGNVVVRNNVVEVGLGGPWNANDVLDQSTNSALILNESLSTGTPGTISVTGNLLAGGGFTVYFDMVDSTTTFSDNQFTRNSYRWGALDDRAHASTWSNNTYSDNGEILPMPG